MAVYTHYEFEVPPWDSPWQSVIGGAYVPSASVLTAVNIDGTVTKAFGGFLVLNGSLLGGVVSSLQRTSADGTTVYESITGFAADANAFVAATMKQKFAMALAGHDTLKGYSGDDFLDGGTGADAMAGGAGNDRYYVDNPGDTIVEAPDAGDDIVAVSIANYTLPANVDVLDFTTPVSHTGIGNELDNIILGDAGKDTLYGLDGNDTFHGGGGANANTYYGGKGNDYFSVGPGDIVIEFPGEGIDEVQTYVANYTLPANVENLTLGGGAAGIFFGNELDNMINVSGLPGAPVIYGLGGNDLLYSAGLSHSLDGGEGNDRLQGFDGSDTLTGGNGDDTFIILSGDHTITDFVAGAGTPDRIDLVSYKPGFVKFGQNMFVTISDVLAHATQNGADTVIDLGAGNSLTLKGVQKAALDANDFVNIGGPGADAFVGTTGHDTFHGEDGDDTMVFAQNLDKYTLKDLGSKISVSGPDGKDTLYGIEHLQFKDGTIHVNDGSGVFDTVYYMSHNLDVYHGGANALDHFNTFGWHEGRNPNAYFDTAGYLAVNKDVAASGQNPLEHYHQTGWQQGRDPSASFDTTLYLINNPDVAASGVDPLQHFLQFGMAEGRQAYQAVGQNIVNGFDAQYYLLHNPDVAATGADPLQHFNEFGWHEGRNPNAWFDTAGYLAHYADVAASGANPLQHYEQFGWHEGRDPSAAFDTLGYLAANPDVAAANVNPLDHFLMNGIYEGRQAVNDGMWH